MIISTRAIRQGGSFKTKGTMKREKINISVQTLPNGYALTVEDNEYMYFNTRELLEGIFYHVGLEKTAYMDKQTIHDLMFAASTWPNANDAVQDAIKLTAENSRLVSESARMRARIGRLQDKNDALQDALDELNKGNKEDGPTKKTKHITIAEAANTTTKPVNIVEKARSVYSHISRAEAGPPKTRQHIKVSPDPQSIRNEKYKMLMTPILDLSLPTRCKSVLVIVGGHENKLLGDALCHTRHEFLMVRGCGANVISILESWLAGHHLDFGMDVDSIIAEHAKSLES